MLRDYMTNAIIRMLCHWCPWSNIWLQYASCLIYTCPEGNVPQFVRQILTSPCWVPVLKGWDLLQCASHFADEFLSLFTEVQRSGMCGVRMYTITSHAWPTNTLQQFREGRVKPKLKVHNHKWYTTTHRTYVTQNLFAPTIHTYGHMPYMSTFNPSPRVLEVCVSREVLKFFFSHLDVTNMQY